MKNTVIKITINHLFYTRITRGIEFVSFLIENLKVNLTQVLIYRTKKITFDLSFWSKKKNIIIYHTMPTSSNLCFLAVSFKQCFFYNYIHTFLLQIFFYLSSAAALSLLFFSIHCLAALSFSFFSSFACRIIISQANNSKKIFVILNINL